MKPRALLILLPVVTLFGGGLFVWVQSYTNVPAEKQAIAAPTTHHQIYRVVDGRTIELENGEEVTLCGVDALQKDKKLKAEATQNLQKLIDTAGGKVIVAEHRRDQNNHIVGEVFVPVPNSQEEKLLNYEQVRAGLLDEDKQTSNQCLNGGMLADARNLAQAEGKGIWRQRKN